MNHNPYNLEPGEEVILDRDSACEQTVIIVSFTPNKLLSLVYNPHFNNTDNPKQKWEVMTNRLTPIE